MRNLNLRKRKYLSISVAILMFATSVAEAGIIVSTTNTETLAGLEMRDGDLVDYDVAANSATLFFNENLFSWNENIDAVHVLMNGNILLSTKDDAYLGGLSFRDGDIISYNPVSNISTLFFSEDLFRHNEDIDALYVRDDGRIILSTEGNASLGGISFKGGDLIEYNPSTDTASIFFSGDLFGHKENIDAFSIADDGDYLISTADSASLGGINFSDGDIIKYNPLTNSASIYFSQSLLHCNDEDIDAIHFASSQQIPEPATALLFAFAGTIVMFRNKKAAA